MLLHGMLLSHVLCCSVVIPLGVIIHRKLYYNIKNEEHLEKGKVIQRLVKTYSVVQCIVTPTLLVIITPLFDNVVTREMDSTLKHYLIQLVIFTGNCVVIYIGQHSLVVAICRYMFIIFHKQTENIGIRRFSALIISSSAAFPIILAFLQICVVSSEEFFSYSPFSVTFPSNATSYYLIPCHKRIFHTFDSPFYCWMQENTPAAIVFAIKSTTLGSIVLFSSNVIEAFIYVHIFAFCIRYQRYIFQVLYLQ